MFGQSTDLAWVNEFGIGCVRRDTSLRKITGGRHGGIRRWWTENWSAEPKELVLKRVIQFDNVSKKYRLGTGSFGLRDALPHLVDKMIHRDTDRGGPDRTLWSLKNVDFALERGQALGIVGPNGAGKTTILKLLSNITQPTEGNVTVDGRVSALIELGAGFHPDLTGIENLFLNAAIHGITRLEMAEKLDRIIEFSGLRDFMDTPVKRYSSGMYVRLGFSVAAHIEPDILLVDEVLAVGDASFGRKCVERIQELRQQGTTIVFVSHNENLVRAVCDRGMFLQGGRVRTLGSVEDAMRGYAEHLHEHHEGSYVSLNRTHLSLDMESAPAQITSVCLRNGDNQVSTNFSYADNVQVCVSLSARESIRRPGLVVRIIRSDGTTCCEIRTRNDKVWLPDLAGEELVLFTLEPLQLASGRYLMEVRLQDSADAVTLCTGQSGWFQVSGPGVTVVYEFGGVYVPRVRWDSAASSTELVNHGAHVVSA